MGTRSLTIMYDNPWEDEDPQEIAVLYRQFDGYPSGHGKELKEFLLDRKITNGISGYNSRTANGGSCLSAQIVAHFKTQIGGFYLHPAGTRDYGEEYQYFVYPKVGKSTRLKVKSGYGDEWEIIFEGNLEDFNPNMNE